MHNKQHSFLYIHFSMLCVSIFGNKLYLQNHIQLVTSTLLIQEQAKAFKQAYVPHITAYSGNSSE